MISNYSNISEVIDYYGLLTLIANLSTLGKFCLFSLTLLKELVTGVSNPPRLPTQNFKSWHGGLLASQGTPSLFSMCF